MKKHNWEKTIFLAHAKEDKPYVIALYDELKAKGFEPWLDKHDLDPGDKWHDVIMEAIKKSRFFLACISNNSVAKDGYINRELNTALHELEQKNPGTTYFIPALIDDVELPNISVNTVNLKDYQAINLFEPNGVSRLMEFLGKQLNINLFIEDNDSKVTFEPEAISLNSIRRQISDGKTEKALEMLLKLSENTDFQNNAILLSSRYNNLKKEWITGTVSRENQLIELNRLNIAIVETANSIEKELKVINLHESDDAINNINPILRYVYDRKIEIKAYETREDIDDSLDNIALFMGKKYELIKDIHVRFRQNINGIKSIPIDIRKYSQEERNAILGFCQYLNNIGFLSEYRYIRAPHFKVIYEVSKLPLGQKFITGEWIERYVKAQILRYINNNLETPVNFSYIKNVKVRLPDHEDGEIDLLFSIQDEVFWFEAKTKLQDRNSEKIHKIANYLGLDTDHAYLILADEKVKNFQLLSKSIGISVLNLDMFNSVLLKQISKFNTDFDE